MLGFSCSGSADRDYPEIGPAELRILERFLELYTEHGDLLDRLVRDASRKLDFSEDSVRFWAPRLVEGRLGPLDPLLSEDVEEVMVNGVGLPVFVYDRSAGMQGTNMSITSPKYFTELANRMLAPLGRRVNAANPKESGVLDSGDRVSVAIPPYSRSHVLSVRKYAVEPFTVPDLVELGMLTAREAAMLWMVMESGSVNLGVVGNTGSGKTTLLNALTRFIPSRTRLVLVEDIPEVRPLHRQSVSLLANRSLGISMRDAIIDSLRLRPDRVIIGEVRTDAEVAALRESCLAGHAMGTYFTYHAESAEWAYRRLQHQGIPEYDLSSIGLLVACRRYERRGKIHRQVSGIEGPKGPVGPGDAGRMGPLALAFDDVPAELEARADFLAACSGLDDVDFFEEVQGWSGV